MAQYTVQENDVQKVLTDDEVASFFPAHLVFTANRKQIPADGKTVLTVDAQLMTLPLSDETRRVIKEARQNVGLMVDGERVEIDLDENGYAKLEFAFDAPGEYSITTDGAVYSPGITIEAV